ncbi:MAG: ATP-binding protein [Lachnospiraceae bacterium]|nr:ATP-binding protein [Lachnospiraceae bacterium]
MAVYLNTNAAYKDFQMLSNDKYFVDKSTMIEKVNERVNTKNRYLCITKPRRFGKTSVLNMLGAYYGKKYLSKAIFDNLNISRSKDYEVHLNQYNVINISMNCLPDHDGAYADYMELIKGTIKDDIEEIYPELRNEKFRSLPDLLAATGDEFIFIIDEWDYIFSHDLYKENQGDFLEFLRYLLKDRPYVALAYMTGVLPIKKYSTGSALNMFDEYTMLNDSFFDEYFGFTEKEVEELCSRQMKLSLEEIAEWYNGYRTDDGGKIYNPRSVILALLNGKCRSYWTRSGKMDEVLFFLKYNIGEVRDDVVKMVNHMPVRMEIIEEYTAGQETPANREEIYAAMIIYGLLSYHDGELGIPNKELMLEFQKALKDDDFGYVAELVRNSEEVLNATLDQKEDVVVSYLHNIHNSEIPILKYNDENSLACVVTLAYLSARNKYKIEREEKSGKGFADFIFYPRKRNLPGIIIELKADGTPDAAIRQIRDKEYCEKLKKENIEKILMVGINYSTDQKEHQCRIESCYLN